MEALLVIDMLNDFCKPGGALYFKEAEAIIINVKHLIENFSSKGNVIFLCDSHEENDLEFNRFTKHCVTGSWGAKIVDELAEYATPENIIQKHRYSGFYATELEAKLTHIKEVWVCGVCTHICVLFTVEELCNRDIKVKVFKEAVASFDHRLHDFALELMQKVLGILIV